MNVYVCSLRFVLPLPVTVTTTPPPYPVILRSHTALRLICLLLLHYTHARVFPIRHLPLLRVVSLLLGCCVALRFWLPFTLVCSITLCDVVLHALRCDFRARNAPAACVLRGIQCCTALDITPDYHSAIYYSFVRFPCLVRLLLVVIDFTVRRCRCIRPICGTRF